MLAKQIIESMTNKFGQDWVDVEEPETLRIMLIKLGIEPSEMTLNIVNAIKTCIKSISPWINPFVFENIVDAINGNQVIPESITKPSIEDIMFAVSVMKEIMDEPFTDDVSRYIACVAIDEGYVLLPEPLGFVNDFIPGDLLGVRGKLERLIQEHDISDLRSRVLDEENVPLGIQLAKYIALKDLLDIRNDNK